MSQTALSLHRNFPITAGYFGVVLGLSGLGFAWRFAARHWHMPPMVGETLLVLAAVVWGLLAAAFCIKWLYFRHAALAELENPIQCCFISLFPSTTMLMGAAVAPYARDLAVGLFAVGAVGQLLFGAYRSAGLWRGLHTVEATTPGIYLPTVASNFIAAIVAGALGYAHCGMLFFGAGIFSWLSLEPVILQRLRTAGPLPVAVRPSVGIQLAPPLVACIAYLAVNGGVADIFAQILFGYGLLQLLFLGRILPWVFEQPFSPAFWSFSFGISAMATAAVRMEAAGSNTAISLLALPLFILANALILILAVGTALLLLRGKIPLLPDRA